MGEIEINLSVDLSVELSAVLTLAGAVVFANRKSFASRLAEL